MEKSLTKKTIGAWLVHHTAKLQQVSNALSFEEIEMAGKCGMLLSGLAADEESVLNDDKVKAIAKFAQIKKTELETILAQLERQQLIDRSKDGGIATLGVTSSSVLIHTADIYLGNEHDEFQDAAIALSESVSEAPQISKTIRESVADIYKLSKTEIQDLCNQSESIGLVDYELIDKEGDRIYFNGNIFRRSDLNKANAVLSTLSSAEIHMLNEINDSLSREGFVTYTKAQQILGNQLLQKMQSIGMYDFNQVSNGKENQIFITKPAAFAKFGNPFEEDALDLAKAFVSSLAYGITFSTSGRGRISDIKLLLQKLINGSYVGPATAIGEDYKLLELRRVIELKHAQNGMFYMKLLKKEVGEIALQVLEQGDASGQTLLKLTTNNMSQYSGPEHNRAIARKTQTPESKKELANMLRTYRS